MAETESKTLLYFIKSPDHDLKSIETFLNKREFQVMSESNLQLVVSQIEKHKPQFIFLALDHHDPAINTIPNLIYPISSAIVIPYTNSTSIRDISRLDQSQYEHKLYPPLSGPSIQRVLNKLAQTVQLIDQSMLFSKDSADNTPQVMSHSPATTDQNSIEKEIRNHFLNFATKDQLTTTYSLPKIEKKLSQEQKNNLEHSFEQQVKPDLIDLIKANKQTTPQLDQLFEVKSIHVLIIQEKNWTGYLTIASENHLEFNLAKNILHNWVCDNIGGQHNESQILFMQLDIPQINYQKFCKLKSDFSQNLTYNGQQTLIAFFAFSPFEVINTPTENFNYIEVPVEFLKPKTNLPFEVCLFLPENNKFLNYIHLGSTMGDTQIYRLHARNISHVYSPFEYNHALLRYKAEFNIYSLIDSYDSIKNTIPKSS